jgi:16S rRNA (cytosine967-C5)-methyltransferase
MRFQSYFNTAVLLLRQYDGTVPLVHFLKQYFVQHKKHGSKDRKFIAHLCYSYFRLGQALKDITIEEKLKTALFLCNHSIGEWAVLYDESWLANWKDELSSRIGFVRSVYPAFSGMDIFPWVNELSEGIESDSFSISHLVQPDLFLRIRPGKEGAVLQKLSDQKIPVKQLADTCLALPNTSKVDTILDLDSEAVIQDYSSQQIAQFLQLPTPDSQLSTTLWDCCAASGGKSILAYDVLPGIQLTVSDIRPSIIQNLRQRFKRAGIEKYDAHMYDLTHPKFKIQNSKFSIILCDIPCTGSGTWGRTPEQLHFFSEGEINEYSALQKKILRKVIPYLENNGYLLYITCSVFKKENEEVVEMIKKEFPLQLLKSELLKGYGWKADSMFAALFKKK